MKDVFTGWKDIAQKIHQTKNIFLFFDFDGTLAPIAPRPELVVLDARVKESLKMLSVKTQHVVGIISGRGLGDLRQMVDIDGILYAGNHGFEVEGPGITYVNPAAIMSRKVMGSVAQTLVRELKAVPGAFVEDKVFSLSVHYRECARADIMRVKDIVDQATKEHRAEKQLRVTFGKKVLEVRPCADWNKGRIVEWLIQKCSPGTRKNAVVWYIGDDMTDEDAFKAVNEMGGITVLVGGENPLTGAQYVLKKQEEIPELMKKLEAV